MRFAFAGRGRRLSAALVFDRSGVFEWKHQIRDDDDSEKRVAYVHCYPVKHGYVSKSMEWTCLSVCWKIESVNVNEKRKHYKEMRMENGINNAMGSGVRRMLILLRQPNLRTSLKRLIKLTFLFTPCFLMAACMNTSDPNKMEEIELRNGNLHTTFVMPATYKVERGTEALMVFRCKYPGMEPLDPNGMPQDDDINVYITLLDNRPSTTERIVAEAQDHFNPERPGQKYHVGKQGSYELYRSITGTKNSHGIEVITYVFQAKDGKLVGVENPGNWSVNYEAERKIGNDLHIKYLISKKLGQDFIKIDEVVTTFINNHLKTKPNKG